MLLTTLALGQEASPSVEGRLLWGVARHAGAEHDGVDTLTYDGVTPTSVSLEGAAWLLLSRHLGVRAAASHQGLSLLDGQAVVTQGSLWRAEAAVAGRLTPGPLRIELDAGYLLRQLPVFGSVDAPRFAALTRQGVLLAARAGVTVGRLAVDAFFELPLVFKVNGQTASATAFRTGASARVQLFDTGELSWGAVLDGSWGGDTVQGASFSTSEHELRANLGLSVVWPRPLPEAPVVRPALLSVSVTGDGRPLVGATLSGTSATGPLSGVTDAAGRWELELPPGEVHLRVEQAPFVAVERTVSLVEGQAQTVSLALEPPAPTTGTLEVRAQTPDGHPVVAHVELGARAVETDSQGLARFTEVLPGIAQVKASAPGFVSASEAGSIVAGKSTRLTVTLAPEKKRVPATIRGHVRDARGGKPVSATVEVRELHQTLTCDDAGGFVASVPGERRYTLSVSAPGFVSQSKTVTVHDGDETIFNLDLTHR
jgi:hypothetical protein